MLWISILNGELRNLSFTIIIWALHCPALACNIMKVELPNLTALAQNVQLRPHLFDVAIPDYFSGIVTSKSRHFPVLFSLDTFHILKFLFNSAILYQFCMPNAPRNRKVDVALIVMQYSVPGA